jgi:addiction module RelE/StbE family toxin
MLPIIWSRGALDDLDRLTDYIDRDSHSAAFAMYERVRAAVEPVSQHPYMFRPGRLAGTREIVAHPNYIIVYRVLADRILVEAVIHARQKYPPDE